jgi:hypothetical protein
MRSYDHAVEAVFAQSEAIGDELDRPADVDNTRTRNGRVSSIRRPLETDIA